MGRIKLGKVVLGSFSETVRVVRVSGIFPVAVGVSPLHVELLAVVQGLELATAFNLTCLIIETDCQEVLHGIQNPAMDKATFGHYFAEIRRLANMLESVSFCYTNRKHNVPAHKLAQLGYFATESCTWYADVPPDVAAVVAADCLHE